MIPRNNNHFAMNPTVRIGRSKMNRNSEHKITMNVGDLHIIYFDEVLPGDTKKIKTNMVARTSTFIAPIMDNLTMEIMYYFVPMRLVWSHTKEFFGENTNGPWADTLNEYTIPQLTAPENGWSQGTLADDMNIPIGVDNISVDALPFRAYAKIVDDWFKDENLQDPPNIPVSDSTTSGSNGTNYVNDLVKGGMPFKVAKNFDVFTSALPAPQKGASVPLPITNVNIDEAPVYGKYDGTAGTYFQYNDGSIDHLTRLRISSNSNIDGSVATGVPVGTPATLGLASKEQLNTQSATNNVYADLSGLEIGIGNINELRTAFQIQKYLEKDARSGSRYIEYILAHFGVQSPDARLQRSEYLGGKKVFLNINQVIQNSESGTTPLGNTGAYSLTSSSHDDFTKSFTEHGYIIGVCVVRQHQHSYQQGIPRCLSRKTKYDFYVPEFANLGEVGIKNKEIYAQGSDVINADTGVAYDEEIFGYQERWYEYRYKESFVSGQFRSAASGSLDVWHLADDYKSMPYLSDTWIRETKDNLDRCLAVQSSVADQIIADFYFEQTDVRPLPVYSIPGLIDHH